MIKKCNRCSSDNIQPVMSHSPLRIFFRCETCFTSSEEVALIEQAKQALDKWNQEQLSMENQDV